MMKAVEWVFWRLPIPMGAIEWLWNLLPDECEIPNCSRHGVRGNENVIDGKTMCDYCSATHFWRTFAEKEKTFDTFEEDADRLHRDTTRPHPPTEGGAG